MGKHRFAPSTRRFANVAHTPCVYAAELSTGVVKVGATSSGLARLMSLANEVKREHGADLLRFHVVAKLTPKAAYEAETAVVRRMEEVAQSLPGRREYFVGITFDEVVSVLDGGESHGTSLCAREPLNTTPISCEAL